jgi:N utilization substance protein A
LEVIVDDTQLSLAIGKKGQNVRLAAKLLGWKIDIKSEEEKRQEVEQQMGSFGTGPSTPIEQVTELGDGIIQKLVAAGITTVEALADMTPEQLEEIPGIGEKTLEKISVAVRHYFGHFEEGEEGHVPEGAATEETGATEGTLETIEPSEAGEATEEAEAENSAEVIEEAESTADVEMEAESEEADQDEVDAIGEGVVPEPDANETEIAVEEEQAAEEDGA